MDAVTLKALAAFPSQLEEHYAIVPRELKHWAPAAWDGVPSEPLTAIEQVCHVRDVEVDGYHVRFRRALAESNPDLPSVDTEGLARERSYATSDGNAALAAFRRARQVTIDLLKELTEEQLNRGATFEDHGVTLRGLVHFLCSHDQQHLAGIQWLLGKMDAGRTRALAHDDGLALQGTE